MILILIVLKGDQRTRASLLFADRRQIIHARIQRGPPPPHSMKNHENIGFLSNTGPDPLIMTKLQSQHSMSGSHRHASQTPFR